MKFVVDTEYAKQPYKKTELCFEIDRFVIYGDLLKPINGQEQALIIFVWGSGPAGRENIGKPSQLISSFLDAGYAVFIEDKPGTGKSIGEFSTKNLLSERAMLLQAEVKLLRNLTGQTFQKIGVYGSSQAAYVIAMALKKEMKVDFMIGVSCPAQPSVEQSAYLIRKQLLCEGYSKETAEYLERCYIQRERACSYSEYFAAAEQLDENPIVKNDLNWGGIIPENEYQTNVFDWDEYFDPSAQFHKFTFPVLAVFGENDTQINPVQGVLAYKDAFLSHGHPISEVVKIPNADHNMRWSKTGCLKEQQENYRMPGGMEYHPLFLESIVNWLKKLSTIRSEYE